MFSFKYDDRIGSIRMNNLRFNPYVGSFSHSAPSRRNLAIDNNINNMLLESKDNPLIGTFRHSPATSAPSCGLGLKSLFVKGDKKLLAPAVSQLTLRSVAPSVSTTHFSEQKQADLVRNLSITDLKLIPVTTYNNTNNNSTVDKGVLEDGPICSICLEYFVDGDELRTLQCSHCFHKKCVDIWLLGFMNDASVNTCHCPQCRQSALISSHSSNCVSPCIDRCDSKENVTISIDFEENEVEEHTNQDSPLPNPIVSSPNRRITGVTGIVAGANAMGALVMASVLDSNCSRRLEIEARYREEALQQSQNQRIEENQSPIPERHGLQSSNGDNAITDTINSAEFLQHLESVCFSPHREIGFHRVGREVEGEDCLSEDDSIEIVSVGLMSRANDNSDDDSAELISLGDATALSDDDWIACTPTYPSTQRK